MQLNENNYLFRHVMMTNIHNSMNWAIFWSSIW